ncbi:MAG: hypothetical protein PHG82_00765 [Candidatus Gracilibacteria bacterium]|nr:hypothetical protein [Candidatus Gracilibacteria bacterium]
MTKAFSAGKLRPSLISVLRSEGYLSEEYSRKAYELFDYYNPIEINHSIPLEEKKEQMTIWWNKHLSLLVDSGIHKRDIENVISSGVIDLRPGIREFLGVLKEYNIPIIIISANGLGTDSIKMYLEKEGVMSDNIKIISNEFYWNEAGNAVGYDKRVIHVFNKDETVLKEFPDIYNKIKDRKNVILLGDSLGDTGMIEGFKYENLLKIGFLNEKEEEHLNEYKKAYDVILTGDNDGDFIPKIL